MTDKQCKDAEKQGKCTGVCDQCTLFGGTPRKEFGMPAPAEPQRKLKAYEVSTDWGEASGIVFAESAGKARYEALYLPWFDDDTFTDIRVRRLPLLDGMENEEPSDNLWMNDKIRTILVRDYGWSCMEPGAYEDCNDCCAKEYCGCWEQEDEE